MVIEAFSFSKKMNSTAQPSGSGTQLNVLLKENTSVLNPHFLVHNYSFAHNYVKWGSRFYFIDDIISISDGMAEYVCRTDVLATYKSDIGASSQYVLRADSAYNLFVADSKYPTRAETHPDNVEFTSLHSAFVNGGSFVIGVQNGISAESAGISYYALTDSEMQQLTDFMFGGTWLNAADVSVELQKELVNPYQYIDSITWYPFDIPNSDVSFNPENIKFGYWDSGIVGGLLDPLNATKGFAQQITIPNHSQVSRGYYLNAYPYTRMALDCYTFGTIPVDSSIFAVDRNLTLGLSVDFLTGLGKMTLRAGSQGDNIIYRTFAQVGVPMKISQVTQSLVGAGASVVGGAVGLAYGNVVGFAQGILSGLESLMPQMSSAGSNGSRSAFVNAPVLIINRQNLVPEDKAQFGRPLCDVQTIGSLSGYVLCENADLATAGSPIEKEAITSYMNSGFYYE